MHLLPLGVIFTGISTAAIWWFVGLFYVRMFFVTGVYHRYFSHKTYKMGRVMQFLMAIGAQSAIQKGVLWWASHHRHHHRYSDTERDVHSPQKGFWWSHIGWVLCRKYEGIEWENVQDFVKFPELIWLNKHPFIVPTLLGVFVLILGGPSALFFGFFGSTVLLWHATYTINSLSHVFGKRRYVTGDTSRNNILLVFLTLGEGWHNNHHHYQSSARNGFFWWQIDITYYILKILSLFGLVYDLRPVPRAAKYKNLVRDGHFDLGMFRKYSRKAQLLVDKTVAGAEGAFANKKAATGSFLRNARDRAEDLARMRRKL